MMQRDDRLTRWLDVNELLTSELSLSTEKLPSTLEIGNCLVIESLEQLCNAQIHLAKRENTYDC